MHVHEIAALAAAARVLDRLDRVVVDDAVKRMHNAQALYRREGLIRLVGARAALRRFGRQSSRPKLQRPGVSSR
jgi:hypothetical protein